MGILLLPNDLLLAALFVVALMLLGLPVVPLHTEKDIFILLRGTQ